MRIEGMRPLIAVSLVGVIVLAACGASPGSGQSTPRSDGATALSPATSPPAAGSTAPSATGNAAPASASAARAAFLSYSFTDVRDGKQFKLSDFVGKQVLVIGMAVW